MTVSINNTNYTYEYSIGREKFYDMCGPSFLGTMGIVDDALNTANLKPDQIDDIVKIHVLKFKPFINSI